MHLLPSKNMIFRASNAVIDIIARKHAPYVKNQIVITKKQGMLRSNLVACLTYFMV